MLYKARFFLFIYFFFWQKQGIPDDNNIIQHEDLNRKPYNLQDQSTSKLKKKVISSFDLYDLWHSKQPHLNGNTRYNSEDIPNSKFDYILINKNDTFDTKKNPLLFEKFQEQILGKDWTIIGPLKIL